MVVHDTDTGIGEGNLGESAAAGNGLFLYGIKTVIAAVFVIGCFIHTR